MSVHTPQRDSRGALRFSSPNIIRNRGPQAAHPSRLISTARSDCTHLRANRNTIKHTQVGNYLNSGTFRGAATGFKLDTLLTLADTKASDRKTSLLLFVVQELLRSAKSVKFLSTELSTVNTAARLSVEDVQKGIADVTLGLKQVHPMRLCLLLRPFAAQVSHVCRLPRPTRRLCDPTLAPDSSIHTHRNSHPSLHVAHLAILNLALPQLLFSSLLLAAAASSWD